MGERNAKRVLGTALLAGQAKSIKKRRPCMYVHTHDMSETTERRERERAARTNETGVERERERRTRVRESQGYVIHRGFTPRVRVKEHNACLILV